MPASVHNYRASLHRARAAASRATARILEQNKEAQQQLQTEQTKLLVEESGVKIPISGCGRNEIESFQKFFAPHQVALKVYLFQTYGKGGEPFYDGSNEVLNLGMTVNHTVRIMYFEESRHYRPILNATGASGLPVYCDLCNKGYNRHYQHKCEKKCPKCFASPPCLQQDAPIECKNCNRNFCNRSCFKNHVEVGMVFKKHSTCQAVKTCRHCLKTVRFDGDVEEAAKRHICGYVPCKICYKLQPSGHLCYMQPIKRKNKLSDSDTLFVFFDLETQLRSPELSVPDVSQFEQVEIPTNSSVHVPNLCVAQQACHVCSDRDNLSEDCANCGRREFVFQDEPIREFLDFLLTDRPKFKKIVVISHYGSAFDMQFVFKYLVEMKKYRVKPTVIMRGSKIITMKFLHLKFLDSFNYFHLPLSALPKAYGFEDVSKGYFPHSFNTQENKDYVGPMPEMETYGPDTMKTAEREKFVRWYSEMVAKNYEFDFRKEIVHYCKQDVNILRKACLLFRDGFVRQCETCPFAECTTIASTCLRVYRKKYLKENTIGVIPRNGYRMADKQSLKALKWLCWMEKKLNRKIQSAVRGREVRLPEGWKVDGVCSSREGKQHTIILNFHGDWWHGCPLCFKYNRDGKVSGGQETLNDRYERTLRISKRIRDAGYNLIEIWECEFDR